MLGFLPHTLLHPLYAHQVHKALEDSDGDFQFVACHTNEIILDLVKRSTLAHIAVGFMINRLPLSSLKSDLMHSTTYCLPSLAVWISSPCHVPVCKSVS